MDILQCAADSILASDRRIAPEYGGGRFAGVHRVVVDNEAESLTVYALGGAELTMPVTAQGVHRPKDRAVAPADVHDAIRDAMLEAVASSGLGAS